MTCLFSHQLRPPPPSSILTITDFYQLCTLFGINPVIYMQHTCIGSCKDTQVSTDFFVCVCVCVYWEAFIDSGMIFSHGPPCMVSSVCVHVRCTVYEQFPLVQYLPAVSKPSGKLEIILSSKHKTLQQQQIYIRSSPYLHIIIVLASISRTISIASQTCIWWSLYKAASPYMYYIQLATFIQASGKTLPTIHYCIALLSITATH